MNKKKIVISCILGFVIIASIVGYNSLGNKGTKVFQDQSTIDTNVNNDNNASSDNKITIIRSTTAEKDVTSDNTGTATKNESAESTINNGFSVKDNQINAKANNLIIKTDNNKYYLADNRVIDISSDTFIGDKKNDALIKTAKYLRLFTLEHDNKSMYYVYSSPVKQDITIGKDIKGTEVTGVLISKCESSLQIESESMYKVSLNCVVYDNMKKRTTYKTYMSQLNQNIIVKLLIVNNEVQNILIL